MCNLISTDNNAVTTKGKTQFTVGVIPNQQGFAVTTLGNIDLAAGSTSSISTSAGQTNIASVLNTNIDTGGILTMTTVGAQLNSAASATYNTGTLFDVNATLITLN